MSVWIICDAPDCDNHHQGDTDMSMPTDWKGTPWDAWCPQHADQHVPF